MANKDDENKIVAMNTTQLAQRYGVHPDTFRKWIKPIKSSLGKRIGSIWTPAQVSKIIAHLDPP